jgi:hypothetical protein
MSMKPSSAPEPLWYLSRNGREFGPVPESEFRRMHQAHRIAPTDYVWSEELGDWKLAGDILPPPGLPPPRPPAAQPTPPALGPPALGPPAMSQPRHEQTPAPPSYPALSAVAEPPSGRASRQPQALRQNRQPALAQTTISDGGSVKASTVLLIIAGLVVPLWPVSLPLCWYLAYRSYKKPGAQTVRIVEQTHY